MPRLGARSLIEELLSVRDSNRHSRHRHMLLNRQFWATTAGIAVLVAALGTLFLPLGDAQPTRFELYLRDVLHFPLFGTVTAVLLALLRRVRPRWILAVGICGGVALLATAVEFVQPYVGRSASGRDLMLGLAGSLAVALFFVSQRNSVPVAWLAWPCRVAGMALIAVALSPFVPIGMDAFAATRQFPTLASFESRRELGRWQVNACEITRVRNHATAGEFALRVDVPRAVEYPGIFLQEALGNWTSMVELRADIYLASEHKRQLSLRIDDRYGFPPFEDRFQTQFVLKPGMNTVVVAKAELTTPRHRHLDLDNIVRLGFYLPRGKADETWFIDNVHLNLTGDAAGAAASPGGERFSP